MKFVRTEQVLLDEIEVDDSRNPRKTVGLEPEGIQEFAARLGFDGQFTPVTIRQKSVPVGKLKYELIAGYRRCRAARVIGWKQIRAEVWELTDTDCEILTRAENHDREELTDYDVAQSALDMQNGQGMSLNDYCLRFNVRYEKLRAMVTWLRTLPRPIVEGWKARDHRATFTNLKYFENMDPESALEKWQDMSVHTAGSKIAPQPMPRLPPALALTRRPARPSAVILEGIASRVRESVFPEETKKIVLEILAYAQGIGKIPRIPTKKTRKESHAPNT